MNINLILKSTHPQETFDRLARRALFGFIMTFIISRICVFLIMSNRMPNFYFFLHGTHVHHLNYGIFLLSAVCGYSVFARPDGREAEITALLYGVAMGLTFDEFGMWLHLGGSYWQRASVDAVIVVAAVDRAHCVYAATRTSRKTTSSAPLLPSSWRLSVSYLSSSQPARI